MKSLWNTKRLGLTLVELVVVIAILGVLAAMLLPKLEGLSGIAGHTSTASSASTLSQIIGSQYQLKKVYPDGWDSLTDGTSLWSGTGGQGATLGAQIRGLHSELVASSNARLSSTTLNAAQILGLTNVGISNLYNVNTAAATSVRAGDMFVTKVPLSGATTATVAIINPNSARGQQVINHVYRQNLQTNSTTLNLLPANTQLVVFGFGPQNSLVLNGTVLEAPVYSNANASYVYNRLLVVFAMTNTPTSDTDPTPTAASFKFKAILGADGDLMDDMSVNGQTATSL